MYGRAKIRIGLVDRLRRESGGLERGRRHDLIGIEERRILHQELLLNHAVAQLLRQGEILGEAVVENSISSAQHHFWRGVLAFRANAPGEAQPRSEIGVIAEVILGLVAQAGS